MSTAPKVGPLTQAELQKIWESTTDSSFWQPLEQAGEGNGFEAYTQAWAQFARVSQAIDVTTQAMFILPWSGQSNPSAAGPQNATVSLALSRTGHVDQMLILSAGTFVDEQVTDWGVDPVVKTTGRRYALNQDVTFEPGSQGPLTVTATAERPGYGYNNPQPATLTVIEQPGTGYYNGQATVRGVNYPAPIAITQNARARVFVDALNQADAFLPQHVGQFIKFTAGANAGTIARIIAWLPPNLQANPPTGGSVELELTQAIESFPTHFAGTFQVGETLTLKNGANVSGYGVLHDASVIGGTLYLSFAKRVGSAVTSVVGQASGATATIDMVLENLSFVPEVSAATWLILDWVLDWGVTCTNAAAPSGGVAGFLDALGKERNIPRAPGEADGTYAQRVAQVADVVSPNAIKRTLNRTIPGIAWCFREAGQSTFPGFFFDKDFYDYDAIVFTTQPTGFLPGEKIVQAGTNGQVATGRALVKNGALYGIAGIWGTFVAGVAATGQSSHAQVRLPGFLGGLTQANRYRVYFDYMRMRGWFYVGLPWDDSNDYGFAYDSHPRGAYDAFGFLDFYDGFPVGTWRRNLLVKTAIDKVRAAGVGFDIYPALDPCT